MKLKWLAIIYTLFLVLLVYLVDQKQYQFLFRFVRQTPYGDKAGHFLLMGLLSLLVNLALSCRRIKVGSLYFLMGSIIVALVVTLEEFSQIFVRYRTFDLSDLFFDYTGIFLFGLLASYLTKLRLARQEEN
ncbi:MAG TPA: VanZ family protein [Pyrinomonadaceae bacterium]|jgi:VanZ family protein